MNQVRVTIGPATYAIRCDPGEEGRIGRLGELLDRYYARLGHARATHEAHNLVIAALFMADDLVEAQGEGKRLRAQAETGASADEGGGAQADPARLEATAEQLEALAEQAERHAEALERRRPAS